MGRISRAVWGWLAAVLLLAGGCVSKGDKPGNAAAASPLPLAGATFDAVWQKLNDFHFDTNFNGHDWDAVREKFRPRAVNASSNAELRDVIRQMLELLDVSHLAIVPGEVAELAQPSAEEGDDDGMEIDHSGRLPFEVRFLDGQAIVSRVDDGEKQIKPGWILTRAGRFEVSEIAAKVPKQVMDSRRRDFLAWRAVSSRLGGDPGRKVSLEFLDGAGKKVTLERARVVAPGERVEFGSLPILYANLEAHPIKAGASNYGYIQFNIWMLPTALAFNKAIDQFREADGLIIDLRGNVGGIVGMLIGTSGHFFKESGSLGAMIMRDNKLQLFINPRLVNTKGEKVEPYSGPVAILVDEITASASEVFAGGMQDLGRARVFGRTTAGQALPAVYENLPNGDSLYRPVADFIPPKGQRLEGRGVIPDEIVPLSRESLLAGRDDALDAAIRWLNSRKKSGN